MPRPHDKKNTIARLLYATGPADVGFKVIEGGDLNNQLFSGASLSSFLATAFSIAIGVGAILAVLRIVYAGYLYMGSADMWSSKGRAKEVFGDAIIGLLILFAIWIILNQINPCLLNIDVFRAFGTEAAKQCNV